MAKVTAALSEGAVATPFALKAQIISATVARWGNAIGGSNLLDKTFINRYMTSVTDTLGVNAGESVEFELQKALSANTTTDDVAGVIMLVWDVSQLATNNQNVTATSAGTTTTFLSTGISQAANDLLNGGWITFTNPESQLYGVSRKILDFVGATDTVSWTTAVPVAPTTSDTARIGCFNEDGTTSLTAGTDVYTTAVAIYAVRILRKHMAQAFPDGYFHGTLDPDNENYMISDTTAILGWASTRQYADTIALLKGEVGKAFGVRYVSETNPMALDISAGFPANATNTGALVVNYILGQNCLARCGLTGLTDTDIMLSTPGATVYDPTDNLRTASWVTTHARLSLNACHGVGIVTRPVRL
jgi:hypothetical protein